MGTAMAPIWGQKVPRNHPRASWLNWRLCGNGAGGISTLPRIRIVIGHQIRNATTMIVVTCMMRSAFPLDSWIPLMLFHQKYNVTAIPNSAEKAFVLIA